MLKCIRPCKFEMHGLGFPLLQPVANSRLGMFADDVTRIMADFEMEWCGRLVFLSVELRGSSKPTLQLTFDPGTECVHIQRGNWDHGGQKRSGVAGRSPTPRFFGKLGRALGRGVCVLQSGPGHRVQPL